MKEPINNGTGDGQTNGIFVSDRSFAVIKTSSSFSEVLTDYELQKEYLRQHRPANKIPVRFNAPPLPVSFTWKDSTGKLIQAHIEFWKPSDKLELEAIRDNSETTGEYYFWNKILQTIK